MASALEMLNLEHEGLDAVAELVEKENIDCEFLRTELMDVLTDEKAVGGEKKALDALSRQFAEAEARTGRAPRKKVRVLEAAEAEKVSFYAECLRYSVFIEEFRDEKWPGTAQLTTQSVLRRQKRQSLLRQSLR